MINTKMGRFYHLYLNLLFGKSVWLHLQFNLRQNENKTRGLTFEKTRLLRVVWRSVCYHTLPYQLEAFDCLVKQIFPTHTYFIPPLLLTANTVWCEAFLLHVNTFYPCSHVSHGVGSRCQCLCVCVCVYATQHQKDLVKHLHTKVDASQWQVNKSEPVA